MHDLPPSSQAPVEIEQAKARLIDKLLLMFLGLLGLATSASLLRILDFGWHPLMLLHIFLFAVTLLVALLRQSISSQNKVLFMLLVVLTAAIASLLVLGMLGSYQLLFLFIPVAATALISTRMGVFALLSILLILFLMVINVEKQIWILRFDANQYMHTTSSWLVLFISYLFIGLISVFAVGRTREILTSYLLRLEQQKKEIEQANRAKDKLFSVVAHDLRTPFNGLINVMKILCDDQNAFSEADKQKLFESLLEDSQNTAALLENLLTWSRVELGIVEVTKKRINLRLLVDRTIGAYQSTISNKQLMVENNIAEYLEFQGDEASLQIILANLLNNAIKYSESRGKISFDATIKSKRVEFSVSDNGIGMGADKAGKLFSDRDYSSTLGTFHEKGTGLGLKICHHLTKKNNGDIKVESELGKGCKVTVSLFLE